MYFRPPKTYRTAPSPGCPRFGGAYLPGWRRRISYGVELWRPKPQARRKYAIVIRAGNAAVGATRRIYPRCRSKTERRLGEKPDKSPNQQHRRAAAGEGWRSLLRSARMWSRYGLSLVESQNRNRGAYTPLTAHMVDMSSNLGWGAQLVGRKKRAPARILTAPRRIRWPGVAGFPPDK